MSDIKSVAILGATGNVGEETLAALLKTNLHITIISRPESKATFPDSVKVVRASVEDTAGLTEAFKGHDAVLSLVAAPAVPHQNKSIDAAVAAGVKWFIPSEFGHNTTDERLIEMLPAFQYKIKVADYLRFKEKDGLNWVGVITSLFFDWGIQRDFLGFDIKSKSANLWDGGKTPFCTINVPIIAKALVTLLTVPEAREKAKNKHVFISSFTTTQNEILAALEKETGEKFKVTNLNSKQVFVEAKEKMAKGDNSGIVDTIVGIALGEGSLADFGEKAKYWNDILLPGNEETVEGTVKKVLSDK